MGSSGFMRFFPTGEAMTKEIIQKLADSENLTVDGDLDYFQPELTRWLKSVSDVIKEQSLGGGENKSE